MCVCVTKTLCVLYLEDICMISTVLVLRTSLNCELVLYLVIQFVQSHSCYPSLCVHLHNFLLSPHLVSDWSTLSAHSNEVELVHDIIDSSDDEHYDDEDDSNGLLTL